jgi:hypothetical protein
MSNQNDGYVDMLENNLEYVGPLNLKIYMWFLLLILVAYVYKMYTYNSTPTAVANGYYY